MDSMFAGARSFDQNNKTYTENAFTPPITYWNVDNVYSASQFNTNAKPIRVAFRPSKPGVFDPSYFTDTNGQQSNV